ncbi:hypothetical protein ILUMI_01842 [Ignelater luminosus]|uniref:PiggyBac transposable element-derived protein domain-containing protein n=1 Tax=Ignelater luminosus TaxID=2038154 RepID=A0A8K0GJV0_IGNLU|nr:hypothetical protein ILUMI_01842 [Ignelater luminosus]
MLVVVYELEVNVPMQAEVLFFFCNSPVNGEKYLELLQNQIIPALNTLNLDYDAWFQLDGCPAHNHRAVDDYLNRESTGQHRSHRKRKFGLRIERRNADGIVLVVARPGNAGYDGWSVCTNQNNAQLALKDHELGRFLGILFLSGCHFLPQWKLYWSNSPDFGIPVVKQSMPRSRFGTSTSGGQKLPGESTLQLSKCYQQNNKTVAQFLSRLKFIARKILEEDLKSATVAKTQGIKRKIDDILLQKFQTGLKRDLKKQVLPQMVNDAKLTIKKPEQIALRQELRDEMLNGTTNMMSMMAIKEQKWCSNSDVELTDASGHRLGVVDSTKKLKKRQRVTTKDPQQIEQYLETPKEEKLCQSFPITRLEPINNTNEKNTVTIKLAEKC